MYIHTNNVHINTVNRIRSYVHIQLCSLGMLMQQQHQYVTSVRSAYHCWDRDSNICKEKNKPRLPKYYIATIATHQENIHLHVYYQLLASYTVM